MCVYSVSGANSGTFIFFSFPLATSFNMGEMTAKTLCELCHISFVDDMVNFVSWFLTLIIQKKITRDKNFVLVRAV